MPDLSLTQSGNLHRRDLDEVTKLRKAAAQFETSFLQQIMQQLDKPLGEDADQLFGSTPAVKQYRGMLNSALAENMAGTLGVGDALVEQLLRKMHLDPDQVDGIGTPSA